LNHWSAIPEMPSVMKVDRGILWLTLSKASDRSSKMSNTNDLSKIKSRKMHLKKKK